MNPYELERMTAQRQADYVREARAAGRSAVIRGGRLSLAVATALRGLADRLDGGDKAGKRLGAARALD